MMDPVCWQPPGPAPGSPPMGGGPDGEPAPAGGPYPQLRSHVEKCAIGTRHNVVPDAYSDASCCRSTSVMPMALSAFPMSATPSPVTSTLASPPVTLTILRTTPLVDGTQAPWLAS